MRREECWVVQDSRGLGLRVRTKVSRFEERLRVYIGTQGFHTFETVEELDRDTIIRREEPKACMRREGCWAATASLSVSGPFEPEERLKGMHPVEGQAKEHKNPRDLREDRRAYMRGEERRIGKLGHSRNGWGAGKRTWESQRFERRPEGIHGRGGTPDRKAGTPDGKAGPFKEQLKGRQKNVGIPEI
jgi:hypothetical protein